jgi:hypothetical protein
MYCMWISVYIHGRISMLFMWRSSIRYLLFPNRCLQVLLIHIPMQHPSVSIWRMGTLCSIICSQKLVFNKNQSIGSPHSGQGRPGSQAPGICPQFVHIEVISSPKLRAIRGKFYYTLHSRNIHEEKICNNNCFNSYF